ncbi:recombinase family protein [uncultured Jatrophihabitans sp.]|uniref:recombinase family protein n=1 Tax=uncultured Jatrophihabitans sp. TaxID=1610747 RepID=UPI0035CA7F3E
MVALIGESVNAADTAALLDADGVPTPNSGARWYPSTVRRMIESARLQGLVVETFA